MATKENKRQVRELVEALEQRVHAGPAVEHAEIQSARDFLRRHDFSPASDYFHRLTHLESRLRGRITVVARSRVKRNYGGQAAGCRMQVQSIYDHLILSTCYAGDFNTRHGRIKISHRFNQEGRMDFIELKYLNSLHAPLNGELRKLLFVKDYPSLRKDWFETEAQALKVLPQELIFLYEDIFRCPRTQILAWLLNLGHGIVADLLQDLKTRNSHGSRLNLTRPSASEPNLCWPNGGQNGRELNASCLRPPGYSEQLQLDTLLEDEVAMPILEQAAGLESVVESINQTDVLVRYTRKSRF